MTTTSPKLDAVPQADSLRFHFQRVGSGNSPQDKSDFLEWPYEVTCNGKTAFTSWAPKQRKRLREVLDHFSRGELTVADLGWLAPTLNKFLCGKKGALEETIQEALKKRAPTVEFTVSDDESAVMLTNVPWEITACRSDYSRPSRALMDGLFANLPLTRSVAGKEVEPIADSRLRLLYCISNPEHWTVSRFKAQEFKDVLERVMRQFPMIDAKASGNGNG